MNEHQPIDQQQQQTSDPVMDLYAAAAQIAAKYPEPRTPQAAEAFYEELQGAFH